MRYFASPEAKAQREKAMADFRAGKGMSTEEAIRYFESLIQAQDTGTA
jgi:hypothetical protein